MPPTSGRSWLGSARPSPSWPSDSSSKSSTCSLRSLPRRCPAAHSHCRARDSATSPDWRLSFLALPWLPSQRSAFSSPRRTSTAKEPHPGPGARIDVALALLLVLLGCALFLYLSHAVMATQ